MAQKSKLKVWILQTGEPLHTDGGNARPMRAMNLADTLIQKGHRVELWSSAFYHQEKKHRTKRFTSTVVNDKLTIHLIPSMGYKRNIGLGRLVDHAQLGLRLKKYLRKVSQLPDVVFIGYPPIETAAVMARWCRKNNIPCLLDVKDKWPVIFTEPLPKQIRFIGRLMLFPYFLLSKRAMREATGIVTMAQGFLQWARQFAGRKENKWDKVAALTSKHPKVTAVDVRQAQEWWNKHGVKKDKKIRFCFVGSLSRAFDFTPIKEAAEQFVRLYPQCEFVICGAGGAEKEIKELFKNLPNVVFPGWINHVQIQVLVGYCIAALAPYNNTENFIVNIPNKIIDYLSFGLPVVSPLDGEVREIIESHNVGLAYGVNRVKLQDALTNLIQEPQKRIQMSKNAYLFYKNNFAFEKVYGTLVDHIEDLVVEFNENAPAR
ncbi:MAG: hypothetical protein LDLANPLL_01653 [Turneriella sp.]|nr:hypothetical protein [Turneriella sp.]